jgi:tRNA pseudouridine13 synthase
MNLTAKQLRVKYPRDTFFSKGERNALLRLQEFQWDWSNNPESNEGNLQLRFELERGCYATIFVRWLNSIVVDRSAVQL